MKIARFYTFRLRFKNSSKLPKWKGNILRGSLGYWLKKMSCFSDDDCKDCKAIFKCPYGYLYRTPSKGLVLRKIKGFPKPYAIKPPLEEKQVYRKDDAIEFSVVLFGDAVKFEDSVISAVFKIANAGLGFKEGRSKAEVEEISVENPFKSKKEVIYENGAFYDSKIWIRDSHLVVNVPRIFDVRFLTPFRLLKDGALVVEPEFPELLKFMLRKYSAIRYQYVRAELDFDLDKVLNVAERVRLRDSNLINVRIKYREVEDFVYGKLQYSGRLNKNIRKVLAFCQLSHIGKRSSYGHGWYEIR